MYGIPSNFLIKLFPYFESLKTHSLMSKGRVYIVSTYNIIHLYDYILVLIYILQ